MKNKMILSIEQMKHLESLGLDTSDASMCWIVDVENDYLGFANEYDFSDDDIIPAYTLQDILCILNTNRKHYQVCVNYSYGFIYFMKDDDNTNKHIFGCQFDDILESGYRMLLWSIEHNLIKTYK